MTSDSSATPDRAAAKTAWRPAVSKFQQASAGRALWQIANSFGPYVLLWYLMYLSLSVSWLLTVPLALLAAAFLVRIFIIFHDCGHGSYFKSKRANDSVGFIAGLLTLTPYGHWRWEHAIHHSSAGHLDKRGTGDVWTMTVQEYLASSRWKRFSYRLARNPFVLFGLAPLFMFVIRQRIPSPTASPRERHSVWWMNLAILGMAFALTWAFGLKAYLLIQLTVMMVAGGAGIWLFYVQHQFEDTYWERGEHWNYTAAALQGSSFYKLPKMLQWFSGNIGFHHIHHLSARIPNYHLQECHESDPQFQQVKPLSLLASMKSLSFRLWDENTKRLVGYARVRQARTEQKMRKEPLLPAPSLRTRIFE